MNRDNISEDKRLAHILLDQARAGQPVQPQLIDWALMTLGDL